jgi:hypothetical protein
MPSKKHIQAEARQLRKRYPNKTVNVIEVSKGNWGCRFSPKGTRDRFDYQCEKQRTVKRTRRSGVHSHKGTGVKTYDSFADIKL